MYFIVTTILFSLFDLCGCLSFPFESIQLTDTDIGDFLAIKFGDPSIVSPGYEGSACKAYPGTPTWPLDDEWSQLNKSLEGALLKPSPPGLVCYSGPSYDATRCNYLVAGGSLGRFYIDDPITVLTSWPQGDTCPVTRYPGSNCTPGGVPVYVVNATSVRQVQIAVNFASNKNIRLVVKIVSARMSETRETLVLNPWIGIPGMTSWVDRQAVDLSVSGHIV